MSKPNFLYLHCHDAGRYIQPYGNGVSTPNLQNLAQEGVIFRNAFCCGPTCSPSRAALVTGQYPHVCGMTGLAHRGHSLNNYKHHIIHALHEVGYCSALSGTQHIANAVSQNGVFQDLSAIIGYNEVLEEKGEGSRDEKVAMAAAEWLRQKREKPFFLSVGFVMPHRNYMQADPANGLDEDWRYVKVPPALPDCEQIRRDIADYNCSVKHMDKCCGIVLDALKANGLQENTVVIATTDHGIAFPYMKCNLTDHGTGIYLIMRGPGGFSGGKCIDSMVSHMDIYPSICELSGAQPNHEIYGKSLVDLAGGKVDSLHEELFAEVSYHAAYEPKRSIRTERYLLVKHFNPKWTKRVLPNIDNGYSKTVLCDSGWGGQEVDPVQLFDNLYDPQQRNNICDDPALTEVRRELEGKLEDWMKQTSDPLLQGCVPYVEGMTSTLQSEFSPSGQFGIPVM